MRRRGEVLEEAILEAAWKELQAVGYVRLTMEAVAERAQTNKVAVYRRWPSKAKLVVATLWKYVPLPSLDVPNTGSLRGDMLTLLGRFSETLQIVGTETLHGLMIEHLGENFLEPTSQTNNGGNDKWDLMMMEMLSNAERRGEINHRELSRRVLSLPSVLLGYELLTSREPITDQTIMEIVDDVFLPLVR